MVTCGSDMYPAIIHVARGDASTALEPTPVPFAIGRFLSKPHLNPPVEFPTPTENTSDARLD